MTEKRGPTLNNSAKSLHSRLFRIAMEVKSFIPVLATVSFLSTWVVILQMYLLSSIINRVFFVSAPPETNHLWLLLMSILLRALLIWLRERFAQQKAVAIKSGLRMKIYRSLLFINPLRARSEKTGELVGNLTDGIEKLDDYYTKYIPAMVHIMVLPVVIVLFVFFTDWLSGLILLLTAPLIVFFMWLIGTMAKSLTRKQWKEMSAMSSHFLDALQGMKTLKIFNANQREAQSVAEVSNSFRVITMKVLKVAFLSGMVLELAASISIAMVAVQVGIRLIEGLMDYQTGLFVLLLAPEFYLPFRTLGQHHHTAMEAAAAAEKVFDVFNDQPPSEIKVKTIGISKTREIGIEFKQVSYVYPGSSIPALENINCLIEPGQLTAVVGATGSGKTTFSQLLMGYMPPSSGEIRFNGIPLEKINAKESAGLIAWVSQHPHFFNASILENLQMANPGAGMVEIEEACRNASIHDFITGLPQGYQTMLTENASRLSGGEKQRLAIARAFLKDAPILVLDEPTSNLDPESEEMIAMATDKLLKDRTGIIIAHRLKTIYRAANIMVFKEGKIAESGTHQSLLDKNGIYADFMRTGRNEKM